jgi:hypothetical protein
MVKRTLVVLGILAMTIMVAGTAFGFGRHHDCGPAYPLFVATCCPPQVEYQQVIKTWSCKIEGPCPPPGIAAGCCEKKRHRGALCDLVTAHGGLLDLIFGGRGGVYGCRPPRDQGPCGPNFGPLPRLVVAGPAAIGGWFFDTMW